MLLISILIVLSTACLCGIHAEPYRNPSSKPTTILPSESPTIKPTHAPTVGPTRRPTKAPRVNPTINPALTPSYPPTSRPSSSFEPSPVPTSRPSMAPSSQPSSSPTKQPSSQPSRQPSSQPTMNPTSPTSKPSAAPTKTRAPTTQKPTFRPSVSMTPTIRPTITPTVNPTTMKPTRSPTVIPSVAPSKPTILPTVTTTLDPTLKPTPKPTLTPSFRPSIPTSQPSSSPSQRPSSQPSRRPTQQPFGRPSRMPSSDPTAEPSYTHQPSRQPSSQPSGTPTEMPSRRPTGTPTNTKHPTQHPSSQPTRIPSSHPSRQPTGQPTCQPTLNPVGPSSQPTNQPSRQPSSQPSNQPTRQPTIQPTGQPSSQPTYRPTAPTGQPTSLPSLMPSSQPSTKPTHTPKPSVSPAPTSQPTCQPSGFPSVQPTGVPSMTPTFTYGPTSKPTKRPRPAPTSRPTWSNGDWTESPTATFQNMGVSGYVKVDPDNSHTCTPLEVQITVQFNRNLSAGSIFYISTPGFTSGPCYSPEDGENINSLSVPNTDHFASSFTEGSYINNYADSKLKFELLKDLGSDPIYIVLDRSNELRHTCSRNVSWIVSVTPLSKNGGESGFIDYVSSHHRKCNIFYSLLNFSNPSPQFPTAINLTMHFGYTLLEDTIITVRLPGFTNVRGGYGLNYQKTNATDAVGNGVSRQLYNLTASTNFSWVGHWYEGTHETHYENAYLTLTALGGQLYHTPFWIMIGKENHLIPTLGSAINDTKFIISSNDSTLNDFYTPAQSVIESNAVGPGCTFFSDCNNHGRCNYNISQCECDDGYGSKLDRFRTSNQDFNLDCSSKACPVGPAMGAIFQYSNVTNSTRNAHRHMECSNNGVCDRVKGECKCNLGYGGAACQKMVCPNKCNERGVCQSMRRLAFNSEAIPMSNVGKPYYDGSNTTKNSAWDEDFGHMCVCDSSWSVGLGAGETQQAEYFGGACQYRHCPTGDDPDTIHVDETNCTGKALLNTRTNKYTLGEVGNLCHVDCSNRGKCNYDTGLCKCFDGYGGENCGYRLSQLYTMKNVTNSMRPGIIYSRHSEL